MTVLLLIALLAAVSVLLYRSRETREKLMYLYRRYAGTVRGRLGNHTLRSLALRMVDEVFASGAVSVKSTFLPTDLHFGLNAIDEREWRPFLADVAEEVTALIVERAATDPRIKLVGRPVVMFAVDPTVSPGQFRFEGRVVEGTVLDSDSPKNRDGQTIRDTGCPTVIYRDADGNDRTYAVRQSTVIGRSSTADLVIPVRSLSRRHARMYPDGNGLAIEDLGSTNGVRLNGEAIRGASLARDGDCISLSNAVKLEVRLPGRVESETT
jgi:hypothetical protein